MSIPESALADAVRQMHGGDPRLVETATVSDTMDGKIVWMREVSTFDLGPDGPARRAFAWVEPVAGTARVRFFAVLQTGPIESATDAVRASILHDARQ